MPSITVYTITETALSFSLYGATMMEPPLPLQGLVGPSPGGAHQERTRRSFRQPSKVTSIYPSKVTSVYPSKHRFEVSC